MKRRSSTSVKKILHSGHTFSTRDSFLPGVLPTKRHVIERILHLKNFRTFNAANDIAREIYDRWVWCNVYPIHLYTISKKVQSFVNCFSALDRWSKKKRGEAFLQKEKEFMSTIDEIFDVFCADDKQRRILEKQHGLKMTDDDYAFYKDQTSKRVGKCVNAVVPSTSANIQFLRRSRPLQPHPEPPTCSSVTSVTSVPESALDYLSDSSSTNTDQTQFSAASEFVSQSMPYENQNRMIWSNLARMSERFQISDRAAAAIANSVMQDLGLITDDDKTYVIDRSKLRRERERCRAEIRKKEQENFKLVNAIYFDGRKDATQVTMQGPNDKFYRSVQLEDHYTMVGQPGEYYLSHFSTEDGKGRTIAQKIFNTISNTELHDKLTVVGTDGTAAMTGKFNGCIRKLEELLNKTTKLLNQDSDLQYLKVGPIVHSRWLTLGCRIFRYYVSVDESSSNLETLTKFCLQVYFPSWFEIKLNSQLTCGSRNFFNLVQRILQVPDEAVRKTALKVVQRNAFFAHQENVLIAMLGDNDEEIRMRGVNKVLSIRGNLPSTVTFDNHDLVDSRSEEYSLEGAKYYDTASTVRLFEPPTLDLTVNSYYKMVNLTSCHQQPPVIEHLTDLDIEQCRIRPLQLDHPCHNQCVERHVKMVTEAAAQVEGFERRDWLIRPKIKSRKLLKKFDTKVQF